MTRIDCSRSTSTTTVPELSLDSQSPSVSRSPTRRRRSPTRRTSCCARSRRTSRPSTRSSSGWIIDPSRWKMLVARAEELVGRLTSNGAFRRYSPLSRLLEIEMLSAGILTKESLWKSLGRRGRPSSGARRDRLRRTATSRPATTPAARVASTMRLSAARSSEPGRAMSSGPVGTGRLAPGALGGRVRRRRPVTRRRRAVPARGHRLGRADVVEHERAAARSDPRCASTTPPPSPSFRHGRRTAPSRRCGTTTGCSPSTPTRAPTTYASSARSRTGTSLLRGEVGFATRRRSTTSTPTWPCPCCARTTAASLARRSWTTSPNTHPMVMPNGHGPNPRFIEPATFLAGLAESRP